MMKTPTGNEAGAGEALAFEGDAALLGDVFAPDSHGRTTAQDEGYQDDRFGEIRDQERAEIATCQSVASLSSMLAVTELSTK